MNKKRVLEIWKTIRPDTDIEFEREILPFAAAIEAALLEGKVLAPVEFLKRLAESQAYTSHEDSVGYRVCCNVASYKPHTKDCELWNLIQAAPKGGE